MRAAREAGALLMRQLGRVRRVRWKGPKDLVTAADLAAERSIVKRLAVEFPTVGFLGEEGGRRGAADGDHWIVDPLDGTQSFVNGLGTFSVCLALVRAGRVESAVTFVPRLDELFVAERGRGAFLNGRRVRVSAIARLRDAVVFLGYDDSVWRHRRLRERLAALSRGARYTRIEGAGIALAYVAAGRVEAFWEQSARPWDMAAGVLLVEEAGGRVTDGRGRPLDFDQTTILATNGRLHRAVLRHLARPSPR